MKAVLLSLLFCVSVDMVCTHGAYTAYCWHGIVTLAHGIADSTRHSIFNA